MKLKNLLHKAVPVDFPIGVKSKGGVVERKMVKSGEWIDLPDEDAKKLLELDAQVADRRPQWAPEGAEVEASEPKPEGSKVNPNDPPEEKPKPRRGRKPKPEGSK